MLDCRCGQGVGSSIVKKRKMAALQVSESPASTPLFPSTPPSACGTGTSVTQTTPSSSTHIPIATSLTWRAWTIEQRRESRPPSSPHPRQDSQPLTSVPLAFAPTPYLHDQNTRPRSTSISRKSSTAVPTLSTAAVASAATSTPKTRPHPEMAGLEGGVNPYTAADLLRQAMMHR